MFIKIKKTALAVTVMASFGACASAQALPEAMVNAARKAVASNPEVQARWNAFKAAGNERDVARGGFLPQVDIIANLGRESRLTPLADYGTYNFNTTQISLTQMLFDGMFTEMCIRDRR